MINSRYYKSVTRYAKKRLRQGFFDTIEFWITEHGKLLRVLRCKLASNRAKLERNGEQS